MLDMTTVTRIRALVPLDTMAARLIILRHEKGWSQREAALQTGVSYRTWQGMEAGHETKSLDKHITAIAEVSGYDRDWLMWGGPLEPTPFESPGGGPNKVRREGLEPPTRWINDSDVTHIGQAAA